MKKKPTAKKPRRKQPKNPYREAEAEALRKESLSIGYDPYDCYADAKTETVADGKTIRVEIPEDGPGFWHKFWKRVFG